MSVNQVVFAGVDNTGRIEAISGRTPFQMAYMAELAAREDFAHFCGNPSYDGISEFSDKLRPYAGPFLLGWFDRADKYHTVWLGAKRVLRVVSE